MTTYHVHATESQEIVPVAFDRTIAMASLLKRGISRQDAEDISQDAEIAVWLRQQSRPITPAAAIYFCMLRFFERAKYRYTVSVHEVDKVCSSAKVIDFCLDNHIPLAHYTGADLLVRSRSVSR